MEECIFCRIAARKLPSDVVAETDDWLAFRDIHPVAPVHVLVIPKKHIGSMQDLQEADAELAGKLLLAVKAVATKEGVAERGYRVIANNGHDGGQLVNHLHLHVIGGKRLGPKLVAG